MTEADGPDGSGDAREPSFPYVLDNLSLDFGSPRRRSARGARKSPEQPPTQADQDPPAAQDVAEAAAPTQPESGGEPENPVAAVRPYAWTGGRTRPAHDLAVEALVSTTEHGDDVAALASVEHRTVAQLCRRPRSVAEVAALLSQPLGVARVLLGDMTDLGLVTVHRTASSSGDLPDLALMERVLSGLRRL